MQSPASQGRFDDDLVTQVQWNTLVRKGDEVTMRLIYEDRTKCHVPVQMWYHDSRRFYCSERTKGWGGAMIPRIISAYGPPRDPWCITSFVRATDLSAREGRLLPIATRARNIPREDR
jgi:hypothetical protein